MTSQNDFALRPGAPALGSSYSAWFPAESASQESADRGTLGPVVEVQLGWTSWRTSCVGQVVVVDHPAEDAVAFTDVVPPIPVEPCHDVAALLHTSVTAGLPRVAWLTHRAVVAAVRQAEALVPVMPSKRLICPIPFSHLPGQTLKMNQTLRAGIIVVILPRFTPGGFLALIQQHRVTTALTDPPIALAPHPLLARVRPVVAGTRLRHDAIIEAAAASVCTADEAAGRPMLRRGRDWLDPGGLAPLRARQLGRARSALLTGRPRHRPRGHSGIR